MKDNFEKRLQRQPMRTVPTAWRNEILDAAKVVTAAQADQNPSEISVRFQWQARLAFVVGKLWGELFRPNRYAWGGIAAVWLTMLVANESIYEGETKTDARIAPAAEVIRAAQAQRRMLAELTGSAVEHAPDRSPNDRPRPHSRRESETAFT